MLLRNSLPKAFNSVGYGAGFFCDRDAKLLRLSFESRFEPSFPLGPDRRIIFDLV